MILIRTLTIALVLLSAVGLITFFCEHRDPSGRAKDRFLAILAFLGSGLTLTLVSLANFALSVRGATVITGGERLRGTPENPLVRMLLTNGSMTVNPLYALAVTVMGMLGMAAVLYGVKAVGTAIETRSLRRLLRPLLAAAAGAVAVWLDLQLLNFRTAQMLFPMELAFEPALAPTPAMIAEKHADKAGGVLLKAAIWGYVGMIALVEMHFASACARLFHRSPSDFEKQMAELDNPPTAGGAPLAPVPAAPAGDPLAGLIADIPPAAQLR